MPKHEQHVLIWAANAGVIASGPSRNFVWKRVQNDQQEMAKGLAEVHESFEGNNEKFKKWMVEAVGFSQGFAEAVAEALDLGDLG